MSSAVGTVLRGVASYVQQRVDGWRTGSRGSQAFLLGVLVAMVALTALLGALVEVKVPVVMWLLYLSSPFADGARSLHCAALR